MWRVNDGAPDGCLLISNHKANVRKVLRKVSVGSNVVIKHDPRILSGQFNPAVGHTGVASGAMIGDWFVKQSSTGISICVPREAIVTVPVGGGEKKPAKLVDSSAKQASWAHTKDAVAPNLHL